MRGSETERIAYPDPLADQVTVELPRVPPEQPDAVRGGFWREISGSLAAGMVVLAIAVLGAQVYAWIRGTPGPGLLLVTGHLGAAALAIACQRLVDRRARLGALGPALILLGGSLAALWFFWWS